MHKLFILAGEASGDRIGADLTKGIKLRRPDISIAGVGGEALSEAGLTSLFPMEDLAVMGYRDVILRLPLLLWRARQVVNHIMVDQPDVVVLIDAQVFSKVVAQRLRRRGYRGRVILYVAPAVWAWGQERAKSLTAVFDEVLSVLPFEPRAMLELGGPATAYVGHPATGSVAMRQSLPARGVLLLLPGSRRSEIRKHLPLLRSIVPALAKHHRVSELAILSTRTQADFIAAQAASWEVPVSVIWERNARDAAMRDAVAAVAVSGTVTLELALASVPHVITYIAEPAQVRMFRSATTRYIGLPNIIAQQQVVPEVLFAGQGKAGALEAAVLGLLDDPEGLETQVEQFREIRSLMEKGTPEAPLQDPVGRVLTHFPER